MLRRRILGECLEEEFFQDYLEGECPEDTFLEDIEGECLEGEYLENV